MAQNGPKWSTDDTVANGKKAILLIQEYSSDLVNRFKQGEIEQFQTDVTTLELTGIAGQAETLNKQKAQTKTKEDIAAELHEEIMATRGMIKAVPDSSKKQQAFGVGTPVNKKNLPQLIGSAGMIISGFNQHRDWAISEAGVLETDIDEIETLRDQLITADSTLAGKKVERKVKTVDKNALQRKVEEQITRISAIGVKVFKKKNRAIGQLFEALIPGSSSNGDSTNESDIKQEKTVTTSA